jgi:hypothetical protein
MMDRVWESQDSTTAGYARRRVTPGSHHTLGTPEDPPKAVASSGGLPEQRCSHYAQLVGLGVGID